MCAETKEKKENAACCDPKEIKGMFEMMGKCCAGEKVNIDCSAVMESMKKGGCCNQAIEETKKASCC